jgi:hypothetical protein
VSRVLTVNKKAQSITFSALPVKTVGEADFNPGATASSGLLVSYTSSNTAVATIVNGQIHIVGVGTSTITASQAGNGTYAAAANVSQVLTVNRKAQTITFNTLAVKTVGDADFNPGATASSGLAVSYTSSNTAVATIVNGQIHIVGAGTSTITASQAGNVTYAPANNVSRVLTVNKKAQSITFSALPVKTVGEADFNPGATASSGLLVSYTSSNTAVATIVNGRIHLVAGGTSVITASQAGNAMYSAAPSVNQTLTVRNGTQTASLSPLSTQIQGTNDLIFTSTASSHAAKTVYPNPFSDYLSVDMGKDTSAEAGISISSLSGTVVYSKTHQASNGQIKINLSDLTTGTYLIKVKTSTAESIYKVYKE